MKYRWRDNFSSMYACWHIQSVLVVLATKPHSSIFGLDVAQVLVELAVSESKDASGVMSDVGSLYSPMKVFSMVFALIKQDGWTLLRE